MGRQARALSDNAYAVLGLLALTGERSGYDIKKIADRSLRHFFWSPSRSQVYRTLHQLEQHGYVVAREVEQETYPDKRVYALTREGEAALRRWLMDSPVGADEIRSMATLRVFFGGLVPPEVLRQQLLSLREQAQADLREFSETEARLKDEPGALFPRLVLRRGLVAARETLAWVDDVLEVLDAQTSTALRAGGEHLSVER